MSIVTFKDFTIENKVAYKEKGVTLKQIDYIDNVVDLGEIYLQKGNMNEITQIHCCCTVT